jgi:hypothetical protein
MFFGALSWTDAERAGVQHGASRPPLSRHRLSGRVDPHRHREASRSSRSRAAAITASASAITAAAGATSALAFAASACAAAWVRSSTRISAFASPKINITAQATMPATGPTAAVAKNTKDKLENISMAC